MGPELRVWLLVKMKKPKDDGQAIISVALRQQWNPEWSIKRIDTIDLAKSRQVGKFPPQRGSEFDLFVAMKAKDQPTLVHALGEISRALGYPNQEPVVYTVENSLGVDW
jgi:hypothetical protein